MLLLALWKSYRLNRFPSHNDQWQTILQRFSFSYEITFLILYQHIKVAWDLKIYFMSWCFILRGKKCFRFIWSWKTVSISMIINMITHNWIIIFIYKVTRKYTAYCIMFFTMSVESKTCQNCFQVILENVTGR